MKTKAQQTRSQISRLLRKNRTRVHVMKLGYLEDVIIDVERMIAARREKMLGL